MTRRRGRIRKNLLDDLKDRRGYFEDTAKSYIYTHTHTHTHMYCNDVKDETSFTLLHNLINREKPNRTTCLTIFYSSRTVTSFTAVTSLQFRAPFRNVHSKYSTHLFRNFGGSGGLSPSRPAGSPGSNSVRSTWSLWWTKLYFGFCPSTSVFPSTAIRLMLHTDGTECQQLTASLNSTLDLSNIIDDDGI